MFRFPITMTLISAAAYAATLPLMPMPSKVDTASGSFLVSGRFLVQAAGDDRLDAVVRRFETRVSRVTGISAPIVRGPVSGAFPTLFIECIGHGGAYPSLGDDESYQWDITPAEARLKAATVYGVIHGLETFVQLLQPGPNGIEVSAVHIEDKPRFPWRGLMLDSSRHWMPLEVVLRNLDAMAAVKLNVFHWHLSDDQGFRAESKLFPRLQQFGSDGNFYTQSEMRRVVNYARDRGIRVVPEFDIPGHTTSWFPGYPDLASAPGTYEIGRHFGVFDPAMDPSREQTYEFLDGFLGEMAALFPDAFFHIGGDEVNGKQWNQSPQIQAFAKEHGLQGTLGIQTYFNRRVQKILEKYGKKMIGWDEVLGPDLPEGTVVQSWRGAKSLAEAASKGYGTILSSGYYLDHVRPAGYHYAVDPMAGPAAQLDPAQASHILGGEACMWGELIDSETVDSRIWPRAAAIAERFWSPKETTSLDSMYERLEAVSRALEWTGVQHRADYGPMLDRLAGNRPAGPLRVLADACEALGLGTGRSSRNYTTDKPLNRLVDAARPESESVRALDLAAARVVANRPAAPADLAQLRREFTAWASNDAAFRSMAEGNALLTELSGLSKDLSALGATGLRLLDYLESGKPVPEDWVAGQSKELARMASERSADVTLAAVRPVKELLEAAARRK